MTPQELDEAIKEYAEGEEEILDFFKKLKAQKGRNVLNLVNELVNAGVDRGDVIDSLYQNDGDLKAVRDEFVEEAPAPEAIAVNPATAPTAEEHHEDRAQARGDGQYNQYNLLLRNILIGAAVIVGIIILLTIIGPALGHMIQSAGTEITAPTQQPGGQIPKPVGPIQPFSTTDLSSSPINSVKPEHVFGAIAFVLLSMLGILNAHDRSTKDFWVFIISHFAEKVLDVYITTSIGWPQVTAFTGLHALIAVIPFGFLVFATRPGTGRRSATWDGFPLGLGLAIAGIELWLTRYLPGVSELVGQLPAVNAVLNNTALITMTLTKQIPPKELFTTILFIVVMFAAAGFMYYEAVLERKEAKRPLNVDLAVISMILIAVLTAYASAQKIALWLMVMSLLIIIVMAHRFNRQITEHGREDPEAEREKWMRIAGLNVPEEEIGITLVVAVTLIVISGSTGGMWPPAPFALLPSITSWFV